METQNKYNEMELSLKNRDRFNFFKTSYNIDYTTKKLNKRYGFGKVNAFVGGDMLNPKLALKRDEINANYIRKNQAVLSKSKTGISTYQYDYCGMRPKKTYRSNSAIPSY
jgi:hypothetical protein